MLAEHADPNKMRAALRMKLSSDPSQAGVLISAGKQTDKYRLLDPIRKLSGLGMPIYATAGTSEFLRLNGVANECVYRISDSKEPNFRSLMSQGKIAFVINIPTGDAGYDESGDGGHIRRQAKQLLIELSTEVEEAAQAIEELAASLPEELYDLGMHGVWPELRRRIAEKGGWRDAHGHPDKAWTITPASLSLGEASLQQKWGLMAKVKQLPPYHRQNILMRIAKCAETRIQQGVTRWDYFVDADATVGQACIDAALEAKKMFAGRLEMRIGVQPLEGVVNPGPRAQFEAACGKADFIGALPKKDGAQEDEHLNIVFGLAEQMKKPLQAHVGQGNFPGEDDLEKLVRKALQRGMRGVTAIHAISLNAEVAEEQDRIIRLMREAEMRVIVCPSAAIGMKQLPHIMAPIHNSIAPVMRLLDAGIPISMGCDNIADIFMPLSLGSMEWELWMLSEAIRCYNIDLLANIASGSFLPR